ncbi:hypothetical protein Psi02_77150 [Planotetraspora silvatica]|uniref:Rad50/SbcC-type AAA domain-containing protein n=1 Tax=Planotetraspora silvatica TaxID=234614 RepID=A0A8J3XT77_9ACTN|nr:ATP-binding protein [Planotetraspora silvatica]GII51291.1 hypothetical protein Psi02_77150 [Planotetraspora silvatica]
MTTHLQIRELVITTRTGEYSYPFHGITAFVGPVGAGKSTMLELIKHVLGGSATLTQVIEENVLRARLHIEAGERRLVLQRATQGRMNTVDVYEAASGELVGTFPVREGGGRDSLSSLLLSALGLPVLTIPRSRTRAGSATSSLTFNDIYSYVYLQQAEIDRSVVYHLENYREPKRRASFEIMFGLTDSELIDLELRRGEIADALRAARERAATVKTFLQEASVGDERELSIERQRLEEEAGSARQQLSILRNEVEELSAADDALREEIRLADKEAEAAREAVDAASSAVARRSALVAQLQLDIARQDRLAVAARQLSPIEFHICPRCLQSLDNREVQTDLCRVCLQPDATTSEATVAERDEAIRQLESQLSEAEQLLEVDRAQLSRLAGQARGLDMIANGLRTELDMRTRDFVSPRFESIAQASASVASAEAKLEAVDRVSSYWIQFRELEAQIVALNEEGQRVAEGIEAARDRLAGRRQRVSELSDLFDEIVQFLEVPWYQSARIDQETYLPIVNGRPFDRLAVAGGVKTLVNLAYHLSLLTYSLPRFDTYLPDLLIVDSPRKNIGAAAEDRALTERIYRRFRMLSDMPNRRVQVIIADNDLPRIATKFVNEIHVDYDNPSVPEVAHPGPDAVERIGVKSTDREG